jgi:hypothetical protein
MKYVRVYADLGGESHFEDIEVDMTSVVFAPPAAPINLSALMPARQCGLLTAPAKWSGVQHCAPSRSLFVFVAGEWELTASDGEKRHFQPGSILLAEDTTGKGHAGKLLSDSEGAAVTVQLAEPGVPFV